MGETNVCFQIDTDNRENFPSGYAFSTFRKQRDMFYEIFRSWEQSHSNPGWTFQMALGGKVRSMLTLCNEATNYCHFARLFKSQLLASCVQNVQQDEVADDESLSLLRTLKHVNPAKLTQLSKRFVAPLPSKDRVASPSFPGIQEFFRDFILHAFNPIFYAHLENCLVHEIIELNDTQFANSEIEESETMVDEQTQESFFMCLSSLRLLAKVLGFLVSLPYRSECHPSKDIIATQVEIRSRVVPLINLQACLQNAVIQGKLSLTIPWVAKYLAMMDVVSLQLPCYKQILELLYYVFWAVNHLDFSKPDSFMAQQTADLLKSTLGWLFELPNFPKDRYVSWQKCYTAKELKSFQEFKKHCTQKITVSGVDRANSVTPTKCSLDKLDIIDDRVVKTCCPRVAKVPTVTRSANFGGSGNSNRHITPVSSQLYKTGSSKRKRLQLQLEEAFFHGQPVSTRKTVHFVSERVASLCVKHICNTLLTCSREANLSCFRKLLKEKQENERFASRTETILDSDSSNDCQAFLVNDMNALAEAASRELKNRCEETIPGICENRITKSIETLLAEECLPCVKDMCVKIATRLAMERINRWIQSHIIGDSLFMKDMELELNRFLRNTTRIHAERQRVHNTAAPSPTDVTILLRSLMWDLIDNNGQDLTEATVQSLFGKLYETLTERADLLPEPEKILYTLSIDFALLLVAYRMDIFTEEVQESVIKIWTIENVQSSQCEPRMARLLCPRNIMLLAQPENVDVWLLCGKFLRRLLKKNVLDIDTFSDQCVALFRHDWPVPILKHLSKCLTEAIADYQAIDERTEKLKYLLGWIAETCHEMDISNCYMD